MGAFLQGLSLSELFCWYKFTWLFYSSTDNVTYNPTGIITLDFQPPALTQTSYFKRVVTSELNNEFCDADSNVLIVEVAPELIGGTILPLSDQYLCFDPAAHLFYLQRLYQ